MSPSSLGTELIDAARGGMEAEMATQTFMVPRVADAGRGTVQGTLSFASARVDAAAAAGPAEPLKGFLIPGVFGDDPQLQKLRKQLRNTFDLDLLALPDVGTRNSILTDMAATGRSLVEEIVRRRPSGPISLVGYSFGASMALEVAVQISDAGREIAFLGVLDGPFEPPKVTLRKKIDVSPMAVLRMMESFLLRSLSSNSSIRRFLAKMILSKTSVEYRADATRRAMLWHLRNKALTGWTPRKCMATGLYVCTGNYGPDNRARWLELCPNLDHVEIPAVHKDMLKRKTLGHVVSSLQTAARTQNVAASATGTGVAGPNDARVGAVVLHRDGDLPAGEGGHSLAAAHAALQALLPAGPVAIYEAGGGAASYLPVTLLRRAHVTVVDIDPVQIANNSYAETRVLGDVQVHRLPPGSVDLVTSYNVIEHLPRVDAALERFAEALRPGGLIFIGAPNPRSLSGIVTKHSPHWFHVWFYKHIRGRPRAGMPGEAPFPVHYHPLVLPARLKAFMAARGFEIVYERVYESPRFAEMRERKPALAACVDGITGLMNLALARRVDVRDGDYHVILRKRA